jgi:hypothetical protein
MATLQAQPQHKTNLDLIIPTITILVLILGLVYWFFIREPQEFIPEVGNQEEIIKSLSTPQPVSNPEFDPEIIEKLKSQ